MWRISRNSCYEDRQKVRLTQGLPEVCWHSQGLVLGIVHRRQYPYTVVELRMCKLRNSNGKLVKPCSVWNTEEITRTGSRWDRMRRSSLCTACHAVCVVQVPWFPHVGNIVAALDVVKSRNRESWCTCQWEIVCDSDCACCDAHMRVVPVNRGKPAESSFVVTNAWLVSGS